MYSHLFFYRVEGPIAKDVLQNFYERWHQQAESEMGPLPPMEELDGVDVDALAVEEGDEEEWKVQLFRSITEDSASFDSEAAEKLTSHKGKKVEASIARAYVQVCIYKFIT